MSETTPTTDHPADDRSRELFAAANRVLPGGVNSPVRAFRAVGGDPPFIRRASGCRIYTEDGAELIDYVASWGPALLGHAHPEVVEAVIAAARDGLSFGACTAAETELAERLCERVPSLRDGMLRMVSSGTEATMSALRLARGFTGRDLIIKADGGYHGHADMLLAAAGSGVATLGTPDCAGVPADAVNDTLVVPYNDPDAVAACFAAHPARIAAVIVEPIAGNMGCVPPREGYLQNLRDQTRAHGAVLIFDEVMTGLRVARGGAQELYGVTPDLTCLAKVLGGGLPMGAYGGDRAIMSTVAPLGPVYQAGTLSGNPLSVAAGLATLRVIDRDNPYDALESHSARLADGLRERAEHHQIPWFGTRVGSMACGFFQAGPVHDFADARGSDTERFAQWHRGMLARGIYLAPSQFECAFVSTAHDEAAIDTTLAAADEVFAELAGA
ncbi:MAG: glutamate-1-semialdehyde-2,1-aminomutase [Myxococcales bacterium FL481]|nr:MAG: glutamate-1-semialdehyde-2,1-aminomutase [Myxococcales bacterium FL481]